MRIQKFLRKIAGMISGSRLEDVIGASRRSGKSVKHRRAPELTHRRSCGGIYGSKSSDVSRRDGDDDMVTMYSLQIVCIKMNLIKTRTFLNVLRNGVKIIKTRFDGWGT